MKRHSIYYLLGFVALLVLAYVGVDLYLENLIRTEICKLIQDEQYYHNCNELKVDLEIASGDVRLTRISAIQRTDSASGSSIVGDLDTLQLSGMSYIDGFSKKKLHFKEAVVTFSEAAIHQRDYGGTDTTTKEKPYGVLIVDVVSIHASKVQVTLADGMVIRLADAAIDCEDFAVSKWSQDAPVRFSWSSISADLKEGHVSPFMDGDLDVDRIAIDGKLHTASITGLRAGPMDDLEELAKKVPIERDIISMQIDSISIAGLDDQMFMDFKKPWRHQKLRLAGATIEVVRDKLRPDEAYKVKPLPAVLIRKLPMNCGIDTISVANFNITYHERNDASRPFAKFPFHELNGTVVNVRNEPAMKEDMEINATSLVFQDTPVELSLSTNVSDSTNAIKLKAELGRLPFSDLMATTAAMSGVRTPQGHINSITLYMNGSERQAAARIWMRYSDLKLDVQSKKNKEKQNVALSALLNLLVKGDRTGAKEGDGWVDYEFERHRDRSVFNYLWSGLREGAKASMLPGFATM